MLTVLSHEYLTCSSLDESISIIFYPNMVIILCQVCIFKQVNIANPSLKDHFTRKT